MDGGKMSTAERPTVEVSVRDAFGIDSDTGFLEETFAVDGTDGSVYIIDWHNALIGHLQHNLRDPSRDHSHGRIWRVTYPDRAATIDAYLSDTRQFATWLTVNGSTPASRRR